jgi:uncharacterized membrane protein
MESPKRSIAKTVSWRIWATIITAVVTWVMTGKLETALTVGLIDTSVKFFVYFFHERMWNRIDYGRMPPGPAEYEI